MNGGNASDVFRASAASAALAALATTAAALMAVAPMAAARMPGNAILIVVIDVDAVALPFLRLPCAIRPLPAAAVGAGGGAAGLRGSEKVGMGTAGRKEGDGSNGWTMALVKGREIRRAGLGGRRETSFTRGSLASTGQWSRVCVCMRARAQAGKGGEARLGSVEACGCNNEMGNEGWGEVVSGRQ